MRDKLEQRLSELKAEFESGQNALNELEAKKQNLRETLLRISGAIQVLEEELAKEIQKEESEDDLPEDTVVAMGSTSGD